MKIADIIFMKKLLWFSIFFTTAFICNGANNNPCCEKRMYWEQLSDSLQKNILASNDVDNNVLDYYHGYFEISDNDRSFGLLNTLTNKHTDNNINALYFYLFNKVCSTSDGAVSEVLGNYCQKILINDPVYVINYFASHNSLLKTYVLLLGAEFYFKEEGTSDLKYNYKDFKKILNDKIGEDKNLKIVLDNFYLEMDKVIKNMD